jgi:hypothetical protein
LFPTFVRLAALGVVTIAERVIIQKPPKSSGTVVDSLAFDYLCAQIGQVKIGLLGEAAAQKRMRFRAAYRAKVRQDPSRRPVSDCRY